MTGDNNFVIQLDYEYNDKINYYLNTYIRHLNTDEGLNKVSYLLFNYASSLSNYSMYINHPFYNKRFR